MASCESPRNSASLVTTRGASIDALLAPCADAAVVLITAASEGDSDAIAYAWDFICDC